VESIRVTSVSKRVFRFVTSFMLEDGLSLERAAKVLEQELTVDI
jgi:hypothetical protein